MPITREIDGFLWPSFFPEENYYLVRDLPLRENDIVLTTYPKCGTNWCAYIVWGLLHPEEPPPEAKRVMADIVFADFMGLARYADSPEDEGRMFFTHLPFDRLQESKSTKFLCVVRNPMDCCVSFYHFANNFPGADYAEEEGQEIPSSFFNEFVKGEVPFGDYFKNLKASYERRNDANVHFMVYEKMKANPEEEILKLAKFLGLEKPVEANDGQLLDKIVEQSSFDTMKKNANYLNPKGGKPMNMLRKGEAGGYKASLTANQIDTLKEKMEEELAGTELLDLWRNI